MGLQRSTTRARAYRFDAHGRLQDGRLSGRAVCRLVKHAAERLGQIQKVNLKYGPTGCEARLRRHYRVATDMFGGTLAAK
jgi:hypothetical protein